LKQGKTSAEVDDELKAIVDLDPTKLTSRELAALKFTRKLLIQPTDLEDEDFDALRKEGFSNGDIMRIIAITNWTIGSTIISKVFVGEPEMPEFARGMEGY